MKTVPERADVFYEAEVSVPVGTVSGVSTVVQAYQFALDPTPSQLVALRSHCGA
jgi:hypothetical protein